MLDPTRVRLAVSTTAWTIDDLPEIGQEISSDQILSEAALSGFDGCTTSHAFPEDVSLLADELDLRDLSICAPWQGTFFTADGLSDQTTNAFRAAIAMAVQLGCDDIVVTEMGNAIYRARVPLFERQPVFSDEQWEDLLAGLNECSRLANQAGLRLCYHPHLGTGVQGSEQIDRLVDETDPTHVRLCLDTGHLFLGGVDPLTAFRRYSDRLSHVHLKNVRIDIADRTRAERLSFLDGVLEGLFTMPGDPEGGIELEPVLRFLGEIGYAGWIVMEAEQDHRRAKPLKYAQGARRFFHRVVGF